MSELFTIKTPSKSKSPLKARSLSDSTPTLAPSPTLKEPQRKISQDDNAVPTSITAALALPNTPSRVTHPPPLGLHLHMPRRDQASHSPVWHNKPPLSPKMDRSPVSYTSPQSVLPRRSRGLDFSRAATNLHHSTLAEQSSPDTSPAMLQRPMGMAVPPRKRSMNAMVIDPPTFGSHYERNTVSSSLGSVNMLGSDTSSSDDDVEPMDHEEMEDHILNTPHLHRKSPSVTLSTNPMVGPWSSFFHQPGINFSGFRRSKLREGRSRHSSSSASGHSNVQSPVPTSPGGTKLPEPGYFPSNTGFRRPHSRRESISMVTNELNISSGNDSDNETPLPVPSTPGVIRRPISKRTNLYPKSRAFGRIKAELMEESAPVDTEFRREAEVIRQVRESDVGPQLSATTLSSPSLQPIIQSLEGRPEDSASVLNLDAPDNISIGGSNRSTNGMFAQMARSSGTKEFWENMNEKMTPPPTPLNLRHSSTGEDMIVDSPIVSQSSYTFISNFSHNYATSEPSRSSTPQPFLQQQQLPSQTNPQPPTAADAFRKSTKRRRDDDLDVTNWKRRAVSPGVSVTNSPILTQSPSQRPNGSISASDLWDRALQQQQSQSGQLGNARKSERERANSVSSVMSTTPLQPKRIGMQGMNDMQGLTEKMTLE